MNAAKLSFSLSPVPLTGLAQPHQRSSSSSKERIVRKYSGFDCICHIYDHGLHQRQNTLDLSRLTSLEYPNGDCMTPFPERCPKKVFPAATAGPVSLPASCRNPHDSFTSMASCWELFKRHYIFCNVLCPIILDPHYVLQLDSPSVVDQRLHAIH